MIHEDTARALFAEMTELRLKLSQAHQDIGALVWICKQAYNAQMLKKNPIAISLLEEIHRHEPGWQPDARAEARPWPTNGELGTTRIKKPRLVR